MVDAKDPAGPPTVSTADARRAEASTVHSEPSSLGDPDAELVVYPLEERYEARITLGEGGMGEVRLCRDRTIGREVAMKVVRPSVSTRKDVRARFVREARVQGQLEHPAIVPVYDFGLDAEGRAFFTMKRVRGVTLERVLEKIRRGDAAATREHTRHKLLAAFQRVCLAVDFAHERGVLHRDLKPSNVMLGGYGEVYVLDWGLAKVRSASRSADPRAADAVARALEPRSPPSEREPLEGVEAHATAAGSVLGTPGYMAPEQLLGEEVDERTDVYGLGAILFELLCLEPLHGEGALSAIMRRTLDGVDARASRRAPHRDVPPELEAICVRACARDRADRYASAREVADAVEAYLSGDRDLELRRSLARGHLERAREAYASAHASGGPDERAEALRELGRALALAPDDPQGVALLVGLLTEPPRRAPPEVVAALERESRDSQRRMLPKAALLYAASWVLFVPVEVALGVVDWRLALLPSALWIVTAAACVVAYRFDHTSSEIVPYVTVLSAVALAATSVLHGPLLVLPALAAVNAMGIVLTTRPDKRRFAVTAALLAVLVPTGLAWLGLHPVQHTVDADRALRIVSGALAMPRSGTFAVLGFTHAVIILVAARFAADYRDALTRAEAQNKLQVWQLEQLVPRDALRARERRLPEAGRAASRLP